MDESERQSAFMSALTTEHFVLQTAANAATVEAGTRASLYVFALSSSLVASGFASRSTNVFVPFVVVVLSAVFVLGVFTVIRLVDSNLEGVQFMAGIAHIRSYYRTISPEAAEHFAPESGRWPETSKTPALRLGPLIGFMTTTASMVAFINSMVGGGVVAVLVGDQLLADHIVIAATVGVFVATIVMAAFVAFQRWRFRVFELERPHSPR
jgi:hypothetical protein